MRPAWIAPGAKPENNAGTGIWISAAPLLRMCSGTCSMMGCGMSLGSDAMRTSAALPKCPSLPTTPAGGAPTPSDDDPAWGCARGAEARWPLMGGGGTLGAGAACLSEDTPRCSLMPLAPAGGASPPSDDDSERGCARGAEALLLPLCGFGGVGGGAAADALKRPFARLPSAHTVYGRTVGSVLNVTDRGR